MSQVTRNFGQTRARQPSTSFLQRQATLWAYLQDFQKYSWHRRYTILAPLEVHSGELFKGFLFRIFLYAIGGERQAGHVATRMLVEAAAEAARWSQNNSARGWIGSKISEGARGFRNKEEEITGGGWCVCVCSLERKWMVVYKRRSWRHVCWINKLVCTMLMKGPKRRKGEKRRKRNEFKRKILFTLFRTKQEQTFPSSAAEGICACAFKCYKKVPTKF